MNAPVHQAAFAPHHFTVEEMWALNASGALGDREVELIEGKLIDMPADGPLNVEWGGVLGRWLFSNLDDGVVIVPGMTLRLSAASGPKPDWYVYPSSLRAQDVGGPDVLLAIEQSDSTLRGDLGEKAAVYARYGVRDYWVIDLNTRRLHVHRDPGPEGYASVTAFDAAARVEALLISGLALCIADLPRVKG